MSYPKTAQAVTIAKTGGLDVLEVSEVPLEVKPDHVVIKVCLPLNAFIIQSTEVDQVEYAGVNFIDTYFR